LKPLGKALAFSGQQKTLKKIKSLLKFWQKSCLKASLHLMKGLTHIWSLLIKVRMARFGIEENFYFIKKL